MSADMSRAACVGMHWLFDSTDPTDHVEAAAICAGCPVRASCLQALHDERTRPGAIGGGPCGTWAGQLVGSKANPREHGTERGYGQHRHYREKTCAECRAAHVTEVEGRKRTRRIASTETCGPPVVGPSTLSDNGPQETTNASRPRTNGGCTPVQGLRRPNGDDRLMDMVAPAAPSAQQLLVDGA